MKLFFYTLFILFTFNVIAQVPNYIPANGLVGWWPFNGNANDESGNGNNGTVNSAALTFDRNNNINSAFSFSTNQSITIPHKSSLNSFPITISLWYYANILSNAQSVNLISKYSLGSWNGFGLMLGDEFYVDGTNIKSVEPMYLRDNSNKLIGHYGESSFHQTNVQLQTWYHLVFIADSQGGKLYLNGKLISTDTWTGSSGSYSNDLPIKIGGKWDYWFDGKIDDIGIWNRALTDAEISYLFSSSAITVASNSLNQNNKPLLENTNTTSNTNISSNQNQMINVMIRDIDGNDYKVVTLGSQTWMAENLRVTKYNDGTPIPNVKPNYQDNTVAGYIYPKGENHVPNDVMVKEDGLLYNMYVIQHGNVCPQGYRLPSRSEWDNLWTNYIKDGWNAVPEILKKQKKYEFPYTSKSGGYYKQILKKCSNCSYWTEQQRKYNPCSVCKNKKEWYVNGDYVPETTSKEIANWYTGCYGGLDKYGLAVDIIGRWSQSNNSYVTSGGFWTGTQEGKWFYSVHCRHDYSIMRPSIEASGDFMSIRCIKE